MWMFTMKKSGSPAPPPVAEKQGEERRKFFRVLYPASLRPMFLAFSKQYPVMDISERGIRFLDAPTGHVPEWLTGKLVLKGNRVLELEGEVVRKCEDEIGVFLLTFIPYKIILEEQRQLINKTPFARMT